MTEKQNNKNKQYNKVIDAMKTIRDFCNVTPCADCPFCRIGTCDLRNSIMGTPCMWTIPRKKKVVQTQEDDHRINPYYGLMREAKND